MQEPRYKKQVIKRYIKIEKLLHRKYHIKDFNVIVKLLYPYRQTINKYKILLAKMSFTTHQQTMILDTAHSLTIINELYRDQDSYARYYTSREDVINAIYMLQNELYLQKHEYLLPANIRWFYNQLEQYYSGLVFTNKEVSRQLRKSKSTVYHHLSELVDREFISIVGKQGSAYMYQITNSL